MEQEELYDVIFSHNVRTGKNDIFRVRTYKNLNRNEANSLIRVLRTNTPSKTNDLPESIRDFIETCYGITEYPNALHQELVQSVYNHYVSFCNANDYIAETKIRFSKNICSFYGYMTVTKHFNEEMAHDSGLEAGTKRIYIKL